MMLGKRKADKKGGSSKVAKRKWEYSSEEDEGAEPSEAMKALQEELEEKVSHAQHGNPCWAVV